MKIRKSLFSLLCLSALGAFPAGAAEQSSSWEIATSPLYVPEDSLPPLVMILMGRDHGMYYEAYNDMTDLDGDGRIDYIFNPAVVYDGLFESNYCYTYADNMFKIAGQASSQQVNYHGKDSVVYTCSNQWSGNFLNYVTTSRMDLVKRILIGGQRAIVENTDKATSRTMRKGGHPYIIRQWIPHDTHVWAKLFNPADYALNTGPGCPLSSCSVNMWTPYESSQGLMLGNVQRHLVVIPFSQCNTATGDCANTTISSYKLGSYAVLKDKSGTDRDRYITDHMFVWNWLARESGNGGGVSEEKDSQGNYVRKTRITAPGNSSNVQINVDRYNVAVESCNPEKVGVAGLSTRCRRYGDKYNTVGLLQDFSESVSPSGAPDAYFGLITAKWQRSSEGQSYAALRAPVSNLARDIDAGSGDFAANSVLSVINAFDLQKENASLYSGDTKFNWSQNCPIDDGHTQRLYQRLGDGKSDACVDWGNPLAQLVRLSHDYFANSLTGGTNATETVRTRTEWMDLPGSDSGNAVQSSSTSSVKLPVIGSAESPYRKSGILECQKPLNLILLDENVSLDWVGDHGDAIARGFEIINSAEKFKDREFIIGENSDENGSPYTGDSFRSTFQTLPTLKKVHNLADVRGVSLLEPQQHGSLKGAALAAAYYADPITIDGRDYPSIQNVVVSMASYLPKFEIFAANGKSVLFVPTCKTPRHELTSVLFAGDTAGHNAFYDAGKGYTTSCGIGDVFLVDAQHDAQGKLTGVEFRVTYEDNDGGSDFDMDVAASYRITQNAQNSELLDVEISGYYSDGYAGMVVGYVIVGADGVWEYNHAKGSYAKTNRSVFFDIVKSHQNSHQIVYGLQSDPFYDINSVGQASVSADSGERVRNSITQTVMNNAGKDNNAARKCYVDQTFSFAGGAMIVDSAGRFRYSLLPRVGANGNGSPVYCVSTVKRKFKVLGTSGQFLPSPLELTAKYGYRNTSLSNYYYVTNASTLADNITAAMKSTLEAGKRSSTALSFPSAEISLDSAETVMASFDADNWTGDVKKVAITDFGGSNGITTIWSASAKLAAATAASRTGKVFLANAKGELKPFTKDNILSGEFPRLYQGLVSTFGLSSCTTDAVNEFVGRYVDYVLGDATYELPSDGSESDSPVLTCGTAVKVGGFHFRNGNPLGSVINSTPQVVTSGSGSYVVFAANDGMIHIHSAADGTEIMSVIPYVAQYDMPRAALPFNRARYILDGEISVYSVQVGDGQRIIAYGSRGLSFPGVYALDLTSLGSGTPVKMLWELTKSEEIAGGVIHASPDLGVFNAPVRIFPYYIKSPARNVLLAAFGNGYNSASPDTYNPENAVSGSGQGASSLLVLNALSGAVKRTIADPVWKDPACTRQADSHPELYSLFRDEDGTCYANGMNPTVAPYDPNHDLSPDYLYSTDLYGNVYRVTMNGSDVSAWSVRKIYTTVYQYTDSGSSEVRYSVQPITTKPSIAGNLENRPVIIVGTGKYLTTGDKTDRSVQSIYGLEDRSYYNPDSVIAPSCDSLTCLRNASELPLYSMRMSGLLSENPAHEGFRDIIRPTRDGAVVEYNSKLYAGWVVDMNYAAGEKVVVNSTVQDRHVYITTMVPSDDPCEGGGTGHLYDLNVVTGWFSKSPAESQMHSDRLMSRATTAYSRPSSDGGAEGSTEGTGSGEENSRKRLGSEISCTKVHMAVQLDCDAETAGKGCVAIMSGPRYCPRVESWQYIYE